MDQTLGGAAPIAGIDAPENRLTNTLTNPILTELVETGARKSLNAPLSVLQQASEKAGQLYAGLGIIQPENMRLAEKLQKTGKAIYDATTTYLNAAGEQVSHAARAAASKFSPQTQLASINDQCADFMKDYGSYVTTQGATDIITTANTLRDAATGYMAEYANYLKLTAKREHPRVASADQGSSVGI